MEKIWIKKELYILSYEFLKVMPFSDFNLIFKLIFIKFSYSKKSKKGLFYPQDRGADMARRTG